MLAETPASDMQRARTSRDERTKATRLKSISIPAFQDPLDVRRRLWPSR